LPAIQNRVYAATSAAQAHATRLLEGRPACKGDNQKQIPHTPSHV